MVEQLAEFLGVIGVDMTPPETLAEFMPYLLTFLIGVVLVRSFFGLLRFWADALSRPSRGG